MGDKVTETNRIIKSFVSGRDLSFIDNSKIGRSMLNSSYMTSALKVRGFKIASINVTSLPLHIEELRLIMADRCLDLLSVNETRIGSTITENLFHIDGYSILRKDRNRNGGGVCIYLRSNINYCLRNEIIPNNEFEMLSVDIKKPNSKAFNVTAAYRHPSCTVGFFEALEAIVRIIDMEFKPFTD